MNSNRLYSQTTKNDQSKRKTKRPIPVVPTAPVFQRIEKLFCLKHQPKHEISSFNIIIFKYVLPVFRVVCYGQLSSPLTIDSHRRQPRCGAPPSGHRLKSERHSIYYKTNLVVKHKWQTTDRYFEP